MMWVPVEEQVALEALGVQALDALIEVHEHFMQVPTEKWVMDVPRREIQRRRDAARAEWDRRFPRIS